MPAINNVRLTIGRSDNPGHRQVNVQYQVCFTACEAMAQSAFVERVVLWGADPDPDDNLITLRNACVRAQRGCVDRSISRTVSAGTLNEDDPTTILGLTIDAGRDEVYAQVTIKPFVPGSATRNSNEVKDQFGPNS
jgi:hypothetical protein